MNQTTVVNVRTEPFDLYIGRAVRASRVPDSRVRTRSVFANPYRIKHYGSRGQVLALYEALWRQRLGGKARQLWFGRLMSLRGKRLGCWCKPEACHGDVLVRLIEEFGNGTTETTESAEA